MNYQKLFRIEIWLSFCYFEILAKVAFFTLVHRDAWLANVYCANSTCTFMSKMSVRGKLAPYCCWVAQFNRAYNVVFFCLVILHLLQVQPRDKRKENSDCWFRTILWEPILERGHAAFIIRESSRLVLSWTSTEPKLGNKRLNISVNFLYSALLWLTLKRHPVISQRNVRHKSICFLQSADLMLISWLLVVKCTFCTCTVPQAKLQK